MICFMSMFASMKSHRIEFANLTLHFFLHVFVFIFEVLDSTRGFFIKKETRK